MQPPPISGPLEIGAARHTPRDQDSRLPIAPMALAWSSETRCSACSSSRNASRMVGVSVAGAPAGDPAPIIAEFVTAPVEPCDDRAD